MADVARINSEFEGRTLTTLTYKGSPCWIAREIGRFLGYSRDGRRLPAKITGGWSNSFLEGYDYTVLQGAELEAFRSALLVGDTGTRPSKSHRRLVLLHLPGLHLVLARTSKPVAYRLRRFLIDEVLPHLPHVNTTAEPAVEPVESVEPGVEPVEPVEPVETAGPTTDAGDQDAGVVHLHLRPRKVRVLDVQLLRERRLVAQHDLRKRMFQAGSLRSTVHTLSQLGVLDDDDLHTYEVLATEIALGLDADELMAELGHSGLFPERKVTLEELVQRFRNIEQQHGPGTDTHVGGAADPNGHSDESEALTAATAAE